MADSGSSEIHLLFSLRTTQYAVDARVVREVVWLPELTPVPDAPRYITGVFDCGGRIVPVLDLSLWLGLEPRPYELSDSVIILEEEGRWLGILVNEVHDVCSVAPEAIEELPVEPEEMGAPDRLLRRAAKVEQELVLLPDHHRLIRYAESLPGLAESNWTAPSETMQPAGARQEIFRERARVLARKMTGQEIKGFLQVAVIELNGEYFGVKLECVREFSRARNITPVPCCPDHILGNVNLRGEVLTVIDIRGVLKMPFPNVVSESTIMVVETNGFWAGIAVGDVTDIASLDPAGTTNIAGEFVKAAASYGNSIVAILDLEKILAREELIVNEEV